MTTPSSVVVIGLGYVGLPTAALFACSGIDVLGVDIDERLIASLRDGRSPNPEPEVRALVERSLATGRLRVGRMPEAAEAYVVCVPTPVHPDNTADLSLVDAAMQSLVGHVRKGDLIILESTSPLGTVEALLRPVLAAAGLDPEADVDVCYCPERVFPGNTVREMVDNSRIVGGLTPRAAERAAALYRSFCKGDIVTTSAMSAEFAKLMENTYRDVNIALANVFARIGEEVGVDVFETIAVANRHPRVNVHAPGAGVGGHCIPVDPWFLVHAFPGLTGLLAAARGVNDGQPGHLLDRAERAGLERGSRVAILGVAYRGNIDDSRESPSERLAVELGRRGYRWTVHDPLVQRWEMHTGNHAVNPDLGAALSNVDAAFVMTDHDAYRGLGPADFAPMRGRVVVDGRRVLDGPGFRKAGFTMVRVGTPTVSPAEA